MSRTALICVDVQHDFLPDGALAVPNGDEVIAALESAATRPDVELVIASRDAHPADHCSFIGAGGSWPVHCVDGSYGAELHPRIELISERRIAKGTNANIEAYSAFSSTTLETMLRAEGFDRLLVGGLATDYCVKATVLDALAAGFEVVVLADACRAVDVEPGDGDRAFDAMRAAGAEIAAAVAS
jgi:nicotinamidase-related amidase